MREVRIEKINDVTYKCSYTRRDKSSRFPTSTYYNAIFDDKLTLIRMTSKQHFGGEQNEDLNKLNIAEKRMVTEMKKQLAIHLGITKVEEKVLEWFDALVWERFKDIPELYQVAKLSEKKYLIKDTYGEFEKTTASVTIRRLGAFGKTLWLKYQEKAEEARKILNSIEEGV